MPRSTQLIAAVAAAAACASCAPVEEEPLALPANVSTERQCFFVDAVNGYAEAPDGQRGRERLYVDTGPNDRWLLETFGGCPELDWSLQIGLDTRASSSLCTGDTAQVLVPSSLGDRVNRCTARVLGKVVEP